MAKKIELTSMVVTHPYLGTGDMYIADNGMLVLYVDQVAGAGDACFATYRKGRVIGQMLDKPVSRSWIQRKVNAFAEAAAAMKLKPIRASKKK
jgi:hypothetical protein